jgi:hypothetical protein
MTTTVESRPSAVAAEQAAVPQESAPEGSWPLLDIGGRIGALIIHAGRDDVGKEIHLCPADDPTQRSHNVVRERRMVGSVSYAAVFPALPEGAYLTLADPGATDGERAVIAGAEVTEARWSPAAASAQSGTEYHTALHSHAAGTTHSHIHHPIQRSPHHAC